VQTLDVSQRISLLIGGGDDRYALAAELREVTLRARRVDEEADLVAADIGVLVQAGEGRRTSSSAIALDPT